MPGDVIAGIVVGCIAFVGLMFFGGCWFGRCMFKERADGTQSVLSPRGIRKKQHPKGEGLHEALVGHPTFELGGRRQAHDLGGLSANYYNTNIFSEEVQRRAHAWVRLAFGPSTVDVQECTHCSKTPSFAHL